MNTMKHTLMCLLLFCVTAQAGVLVTPTGANNRAFPPSLGVIRQRDVTVDLTQLDKLTFRHARSASQTLQVKPFSDVTFDVNLTEKIQHDDHAVYTGRVVGADLDNVQIVVNDVAFTMTIDDYANQRHYRIGRVKSARAGVSKEFDTAVSLPQCGVTDKPNFGVIPENKTNDLSPAVQSRAQVVDCATQSPNEWHHRREIDLMLVFDDNARQWLSTNEPYKSLPIDQAMQTFSQKATARLNLSMKASCLNINFDLVKVQATNYQITESKDGLIHSLNSLYTASEPWSAKVRQDQEGAYADVVAMLTLGNFDNIVGIATPLYQKLGQAKASVSISRIDLALPYGTLMHEIGHNLGAGHDKLHGGPNPAFTNSTGAYFGNDAFRTVMSYPKEGKNIPVVQIFSSPNVFYQGQPASDADGSNNRAVLRYMARFVGAYQTSGNLDGITLDQGADREGAVANLMTPFVTGKKYPWFGQTYHFTTKSIGHDGVQSKAVKNAGEFSYLRTTIKGPGTLTFYSVGGQYLWKDFKFYNFGKYELLVNGKVVRNLNSHRYTTHNVALGKGTNTVEWRFTRTSQKSMLWHTGWLDGVTFKKATWKPGSVHKDSFE